MNRLVITADDFGLSLEVNEAVEEAHRRGVVTAASLMSCGPAAADAVARARRMPGLRVGLHIVLVDGWPALPPECVPRLMGDGEGLRTDMIRLAFELAWDAKARRQVAEEIGAQFAAFRRTGLPLDHVNGHKHVQLHPVIARRIVEIGREYEMRALRIPAEPSLARLGAAKGSRIRGRILLEWARVLRSRARARGLVVPDAVFGLAWSGAMTATRLRALVGSLPTGLVEIYAHPARSDDFPGHAPGYDYTGELAALCDCAVADLVRRSAHDPGGYLS